MSSRAGPGRALVLAMSLAGCPTVPPEGDASGPTDAAMEAPPPACNANGAVVYMGTARDATLANFTRLGDASEVALVPGPQGGQHIWVALRGSRFDATQPRIELRAYRVTDGTLIGQLRIRLPMSVAPEDPGLLGLPAQPLALDDHQYCSVLPGDVRIDLRFDDGRGHCVQQQVRVRVTGIDPAAFPIDREAREACCRDRHPRCYPPGGMPFDSGVILDRRDGALD